MELHFVLPLAPTGITKVIIVIKIVIDFEGDSNVEGFATSNSIFHLLNHDKCKNAPGTLQELQANLRNTPNGASSG